MNEPIDYLNGQIVPASQAVLPVFDAGFVLGATATEQLRTFGGKIFRLADHLSRLERSLSIMQLAPAETMADLADIGERLVRHNRALVEPDDDLGLCIFVTPGPYIAMSEGYRSGPWVGMHTYRLPFFLWAQAYEHGIALATTLIQQVPAECWPSELKCRSRMHYFLADRAAAASHPGARAVLQNSQGNVTELTTANLVLYFEGEGFVAPPKSDVLPGISLQMVVELAAQLQIPFTERAIRPEDLAAAREVLVTSTPNCLLPVTQFNGQPVGNGEPGPIYRQLLSAWNARVGLDIAAQALRYASRQ